MEITIREYKTSDTKAIYYLNKNELGYEYSLAETEKNLSKLSNCKSHKIFVAVQNQDVVGYIHAADYDLIYATHMKNIMGIAVSSYNKRKGIGKLLLQAIEQWAKNTGASGVRLVSGSSRTDAHQFYTNCGYYGGKQQLNFKKYL